MQFIVLSSSRGTVFQSVIDRIQDGSLHAKCLGLIADRHDRSCVEKAVEACLPVSIVEKKDGENREDYDRRVHRAILELSRTTGSHVPRPASHISVLACMGWMTLLSPWFVRRWKNRILNVHPALLPKYPGTHAHEEVLKHGDKESGMTIHLIDEGVDTGRILVQKHCPVLPDDTVETLKKRVQALECEWYPKVLAMIESGEMAL